MLRFQPTYIQHISLLNYQKLVKHLANTAPCHICKILRIGKQKILCVCLIPFVFLLRAFLPRWRFCYLRTARTGHLALEPDLYFLKLLRNETELDYDTLIFIPNDIVCNQYLLDLIRRIVVPGLSIRILSSRLATRFCHLLLIHPLFNSQCISIALVDEWYGSVVGAPRQFLPRDTELSALNEWLLDNDNYDNAKPCILLHNRDSAFLPSSSYHSYRDFSPHAFIPTINKYSSHFNFIRGGRIAVEKLYEKMPGVIDMPYTDHSDLVDMLIHHKSLFYFGSDSGILCVSLVFRKPVAIINFPPTSFGSYRNNNCFQLGFIPKKLICKDTGRSIGIVEMYERNIVDFWSTSQYDDARVQVVDNTAEEVLQFFEEALSIYNHDMDKSTIYTEEQEEFWRIIAHYEPDHFQGDLIKENFFVGTGYLIRNQYLYAT